MELTMAATPKARQATPAPSSRPARAPLAFRGEARVLDSSALVSGVLAFPVPPPPPNTERMMPVFAFPPPNDPNGPTRAQEVRPTRRATARVPGRGGSRSSLRDSLAGLASFVEHAPLPALPESVWKIIGRAWFFIAGATMGILLALALIAINGPKHSTAREGRIVTAEGTARVLVVQRAPTAAERGVGPLAENDLDEVVTTPVPTPSPVNVRRNAIVARRPATAHRPATGGKDLLNAGL